MIVVAALVLFFLSVLPAEAVIKYVDNTSSGGCTNGATTYNPATKACGAGSATVYLSIQAGGVNLGAGNTLQIRAGTYPSELCVIGIAGGSSSVPTRVEPYPSESVVWGKGLDTRDCMISFTNSWVVIDGKNSDGTGSITMNGNSRNVTTDQAILVGNNTTNLTIRNIELYNGAESCINNIGANSLIENNYIHDCGTVNSYLWHGIYYSASGTRVINNTFQNIAGYGIHCYSSGAPSCDTSTIERNRLINIATATDAQSGGILVDGTGNIVRYNVVRCSAGTSDYGIRTYIGASGTLVQHNSVTNCNLGIELGATTSGAVVQNNAVFGNVTAISDAASGTTLTTNLTIDPSWVSAFSADLRLNSGSAAVDACTNIGLAYNGSAPDCGAFETFAGFGGTVTGNTIDAQMTMNLNTPVISGTTGFSVNNSRTVTGVTVVGSSVVRITFNGAACAGETWTWSYSGGTATDTSAVGSSLNGRLNQPLFTVAPSTVTNICSGASYTFTQSAFRFHAVHGTEASPTLKSTENQSSVKIIKGGAARLRFSVVCGGSNCPPSSFSLFYAQGGGYSAVPSSFGAGNVSFCSSRYSGLNVPANTSPTTNLLSTSGSFVSGALMLTADAIPTITLSNTNKTELEYCVQFNSAAAGEYTFRVYLQSGTALTAYTNTPSVTIGPVISNSGF